MSPTTLQQRNEAFLAILNALNPQQKEAVTHFEGPMLVVAGPGTGKTHILAARIGKILLDTDAQAHNILCLTFTDAGVLAMRERLLSLIGYEAHKVHIYTFHSFCNTIIRDNAEIFGTHDLEPLSDLERVEVIKDILEHLDFKNPLIKGRKDVGFQIQKLSALFKKIKQEAWSVEGILRDIQVYLDSLPSREEFIYKRKSREFKKGDVKQASIDEVNEKMEKLKAAVQLFPIYEQKLKEKHRYDFEDMLLWVLKAFDEHEYLLRSYQERYLYFLIDEYQDTNGAQNNILLKLIQYWDNPNIFIVGDDDQSIYEFQGARLKNLTDFYEKYNETLRVVVLEDNYRSTQAILDNAKKVIDINTYRIAEKIKNQGFSKKLVAKRTDLVTLEIAPKVLSFPNRLQEIVGVVVQIEKLKSEGVSLDEIAIIYAKHKQAEQLIQLLDQRQIPYNVKKKANILNYVFIQQVITILEYVQLESIKPFNADHLLFKLLHFAFFNIPLSDIAALSLFLAKQESNIFWRKAISDKAILEEADVKDTAAFVNMAHFLEQLISSNYNSPLLILLEKIINQSGLLQYIIKQEDKTQFVQILNTFFDFVKAESDKNPRIQLHRLLEIIYNMDDNRIPIEIQQQTNSEVGIHLHTAHNCKGLEFKYVFIIDMSKEFWEPNNRMGGREFAYPDTLTFSGEEDLVEARRRLFYVALTRAKAFVQISYSELNNENKKIEKAQYLDEMLDNNEGVVVEVQKMSNDEIVLAQIQLLSSAAKPKIEAMEKSRVNELLKDFKLSISSLNRFLYCPLSFYYEHILKIPSVSSEAASFGTAMHFALMQLFEKMQRHPNKTFPNVQDFVLYFKQELQRQRNVFSKNTYERFLKIGEDYLEKYYFQNFKSWNKKVLIEHELRNVHIKGVPVTGTIDKIEFLEGMEGKIIDYKTGKIYREKIAPPSEKLPFGGNYWRQLYFYKLLYENHPYSNRSIKKGEIVYLEPDVKGVFQSKEIEFEANFVDFIENLISTSYQKIMNHEFYEGCGEPDCQWCNFVQRNQNINSFQLEDFEALDD